MLYLEDYLELIEHLPQETIDRLTDMRELDLQVHNSLHNIEKRTTKFFLNAPHMPSSEMEAEHNGILKDYKKVIEDSEEKIQIANFLSDSMAKYMRRLDQDLMKFKMELEADNSGITEIIEKRVEEPEEPQSVPPALITPQSSRGPRKQSYQLMQPHIDKYSESSIKTIPAAENKRQEVVNAVEQKLQRLLPMVPSTSTSHSQVMFNVEQMGAGGSAIAAAASQAIVATQQMQQGRRSASLKASYEAINSGGVNFGRANEVSNINKELSGAAQTAIAAVQYSQKKHKRRGRQTSVPQVQEIPKVEPNYADVEIKTEETMEADPDEPRYCVCNEVAFGDMVACDNKNCQYEWYHYPCVGITDPPKGKWYCPQCSVSMKRRSKKSQF